MTLRAKKDEPEIGGDYYGSPWPCWGTPQIRHPGTHTLYNTNLHAKDGGGTFRARFGVVYEEHGRRTVRSKNVNLSWPKAPLLGRLELTDGYPGVHLRRVEEARPAGTRISPEAEPATIKIGGNNPDGVGWAIDLSGGIIRVTLDHGDGYGNGGTRGGVEFAGPGAGASRAASYTPRPELVAKATRRGRRTSSPHGQPRRFRKAAVDKGLAKQFPIIPTSGRLVEYEGGGEETRSNRWLAELQQDMFVEVNTS